MQTLKRISRTRRKLAFATSSVEWVSLGTELLTVIRPEVRHILGPATGYGTRAIEDLEARGFRGNFLPPGIEGQVVFRDWDVLVVGVANIVLYLPTDLRAFIRDQRATPGFEIRI